MSDDNIAIVFIPIMIFCCIVIVLSIISLVFMIIKGKKELDRINEIFTKLLNQEKAVATEVLNDLVATNSLILDLDEAWKIFQPILNELSIVVSIWAEKTKEIFTESSGQMRCNTSSLSCPIDNTKVDSLCAGNPCTSADFTDNSSCCSSR
tara:strand:+ start:364 stop:816 length:453 start_codon:yes stop_codon:yes gene_type:complete